MDRNRTGGDAMDAWDDESRGAWDAWDAWDAWGAWHDGCADCLPFWAWWAGSSGGGGAAAASQGARQAAPGLSQQAAAEAQLARITRAQYGGSCPICMLPMLPVLPVMPVLPVCVEGAPDKAPPRLDGEPVFLTCQKHDRELQGGALHVVCAACWARLPSARCPLGCCVPVQGLSLRRYALRCMRTQGERARHPVQPRKHAHTAPPPTFTTHCGTWWWT